MNIGDTWTCPACKRKYKMTAEGVRCSGKGHLVYESLERESYSLHGAKKESKVFKKDDNQQLTMF